MNQNWILLPIVAQVFLTLMLFIRLGSEKTKAIKSGYVDREKARLHHDAWPDTVLKVSNNIENQFETPILFYVISVALHLMNAVDPIVVSLATVYVITRYFHAYVHTSSNYVPWRYKIFVIGVLILFFLVFIVIGRLAFILI